METIRIRKGQTDIHTWLEAIARERTPSGKYLPGNMTLVADGEVVEITTSGGQHFGSGGYSAGSAYAGNEPVFVAPTEGRHTSFISDSISRFQFTAPCVVQTYGGDFIGEGRSWFHVFVCAAPEQYEEAKRVMAVRRREEAETGDLALLLSTLESWFNVSLRHHHVRGTCYGGCPEESRWLGTVRANLERGEIVEAGIAEFAQPVRAAIRKAAMGATPQERLAMYEQARNTIEAKIAAEKKVEGRAFAHQVIDQMVSAGLNRDAAWKILRAAGPGRAQDALTFVTQWVNVVAPRAEAWHASCYGMLVFLKGLAANANGQRDIHEALNGMGLESPAVKATHLWSILNGAIAALEVGLPEAFFSGTGLNDNPAVLVLDRPTVEALLYRQG